MLDEFNLANNYRRSTIKKVIRSTCKVTCKGCLSRTLITKDAVVNVTPSIRNGDTIGLGSKRLGWLQTFLNCMSMFMTLRKWPVARVSRVLEKNTHFSTLSLKG